MSEGKQKGKSIEIIEDLTKHQIIEIQEKLNSLQVDIMPHFNSIRYAIDITEIYAKSGKDDVQIFFQEQLLAAIIDSILRDQFSKNQSQNYKDRLLDLYRVIQTEFLILDHERFANTLKKFELIFKTDCIPVSDNVTPISGNIEIIEILKHTKSFSQSKILEDLFLAQNFEFEKEIYALTTLYAIEAKIIDVRRGKRLKNIKKFLSALKPNFPWSVQPESMKQFSSLINKFEIQDFRNSFENQHQETIRSFLRINDLAHLIQ